MPLCLKRIFFPKFTIVKRGILELRVFSFLFVHFVLRSKLLGLFLSCVVKFFFFLNPYKYLVQQKGSTFQTLNCSFFFPLSTYGM